MNKGEHIEGLITAPFTPMTEKGELRLEMVKSYAAFLHSNGIGGVFVNGTTGESMSLTLQERLEHAGRWIEDAPDGLKVLIHVGHTCLKDCRRMAAHAQEHGAYGIGAMAPCFFLPKTVDELADWCAGIAEAAPDLPFYFYHMPGMTGVDLRMIEFLPRAVERIPSFRGIKFTYEDLDDYRKCVRFAEGACDILFGRDEHLLNGLECGARGAIGSTYNFAAPLYLGIISDFRNGDMESARRKQKASADMIEALYATGCTVGAFKSIMARVGLDVGPTRPPLPAPSPQAAQRLHKRLDELHFSEWCAR